MEKHTAKNYRKSIMLFLKAIMFALTVSIFFYTYIHHYIEATFFARGNLVLWAVYVCMYGFMIHIYGAYKIGAVSIGELQFSNALSLVIANVFVYFIMSLIAEKMLGLWAIIFCTIIQILLVYICYRVISAIHAKLYPKVDAIMITDGSKHDGGVREKFKSTSVRYHIANICSGKHDFEYIRQKISGYPAVVIGEIDSELRAKLLLYCYEQKKNVFIVPYMSDIIFHSAQRYMSVDTFVYKCSSPGFSVDQLIVKRATDIIISALGLIVTLPITLITAIAIKICDGGPLFYTQERLTRNGKHFTLYKFRSMIVDAEALTGARLAGACDPRITPVGKFIRATRIDELPQLINVLRGDMSMVGPRPERPVLFDKICEQFPEFAYRLKVKAGLTGFAQLYGKYNTSFEDKVRLDMLYIEQASLRMDFELMFYTIKILFMKDSTEGVADFPENTDNHNGLSM